jgi:hypothetical protein
MNLGHVDNNVMANNTTLDAGGPDLTVILLVHWMFREEFAALADAAARTQDPARGAALEDQLALMLRVLHEHHTGEDTLMWPLVRQRDPASAAVLDAMEAEHQELDPLIERAGAAGLPLAERAEPLSRLSERLNAHLDREEEEALPFVQRHMTADEFAALDKTMMKGLGDDLPAVGGAVMWHATPDEGAGPQLRDGRCPAALIERPVERVGQKLRGAVPLANRVGRAEQPGRPLRIGLEQCRVREVGEAAHDRPGVVQTAEYGDGLPQQCVRPRIAAPFQEDAAAVVQHQGQAPRHA